MADNRSRLILGSGEKHRSHAVRRQGGGKRDLPYTYEQAQGRITKQVNDALETVASLPKKKKFADETVLCVKLHPDFLAKSYDPNSIFRSIPFLEKIGSRNYRVDPEKVGSTKSIRDFIQEHPSSDIPARLIFVRGSEKAFERMLSLLITPPSKEFREEIQIIEKFEVLSSSDQVTGFPENWTSGRVEMVFHPSRRSQAEFRNFLLKQVEKFKVPKDRINIASYEDGPTFISCWLNTEALKAVTGSNPLRAIHPLQMRQLEQVRHASFASAPLPPVDTSRSTIRVGMFDGGVNLTHELLRPYVEQDETLAIETDEDEDLIAHGNAVAGSILYGPLNGRDPRKPLPTPEVTVVSIRALPTSNPDDEDLYECIDVIEKAVPARSDVKWWNVSFGPIGPIIDEDISRFTFALDRLMHAHGVRFCVAVGNTGDSDDGLVRRIQSPSDIVNGFGVGGYTYQEGKKIIRAPYSCQGPGREPGKVKPDLVAYSGCRDYPLQLVSFEPKKIVYEAGTSFSSPKAASVGAQLTGKFDRSDPLVAGMLMIHNAQNPNGAIDDYMGFGIVPEVEDVLYCSTNSVTVIYRDSIDSSHYAALPIFIPKKLRGYKVADIKWTIGIVAPVDSRNPSDYTSCCVEDWFYPHSSMFRFAHPTKKGSTKILHIEKQAAQVESLVSEGWKQSRNPVSESLGQSEQELRTKVLKWETIVTKALSMREKDLQEPHLILHANPRNGWGSPIDFAVAATITLPEYNGDLYAQISREYDLQPIRLRAENRYRV